jgi:hypothetical protein
MKWVPANWKWSSTIRKIDDDSNSSNFYLNIDLSCQFERDFKGIYTELPIENATIKLYAFLNQKSESWDWWRFY